MRLTRPTDFEILEQMSDGKRQTAANLAALLDKDRNYMNTRLPELESRGLLHRVGPSERSGMYVITEKGVRAAANRDRYEHDSHREFEELLNGASAEPIN